MSHSNPNGYKQLLVTGGGGYVGSALVPALLDAGYRVRVLDTFWYGKQVFGDYLKRPELELVELDLRETKRVGEAMKGVDAVIHLACISNDPSFDLDPTLGRAINYDAFRNVIDACEHNKVGRLIVASSTSQYGVKPAHVDVTEDIEAEPITDYARFKLDCERDLLARSDVRSMDRVIIRPATVCGYAPRLRLDLSVNILTIHALVNHKIRIFGGKQLRPNLNIKDMVRAYLTFLAAPVAKVDREAFNIGFQNLAIEKIAFLVRDTIGDQTIELEYTPSDDNRSYHVNSDKVLKADVERLAVHLRSGRG